MFNNMTGQELIDYAAINKMSTTDRLAFDRVTNELVHIANELTPEQQAEVINEINGTNNPTTDGEPQQGN